MTTLAIPSRMNAAPSAAYRAIGRVFLMYLTLYGYMKIFLFAYTAQVAVILPKSSLIKYDPARWFDYELACLLLPLAFLPIGTRLNSAAQYLLGPLIVMVLLGIPIVFLGQVPPGTYWWAFAMLWIGAFIMSVASRYSFALRATELSPARYTNVANVLLAAFVLLLGFAARTHLDFVSFSDLAKARQSVEASGLLFYTVYNFTGGVGGFFIAYGITQRRIVPVIVGVVGFVVCFGVLAIKLAALAPAWIGAFYLARRYFCRDSFIRYLIVLMAPDVLTTLWIMLVGYEPLSPQFWAWGIINFRLYYIPASAFNVYYDFFQLHPYTYWSHINIVGLFVHNPYPRNLYVLLNDYYHQGNFTAAFVMVDGLAAGGVEVIPIACAVFGLVLMFFNSCGRGLDPVFLGTCLAMPAIAFVDGGSMGTTLVSQGALLVAVLLLFAPRSPPFGARAVARPGLRS